MLTPFSNVKVVTVEREPSERMLQLLDPKKKQQEFENAYDDAYENAYENIA